MISGPGVAYPGPTEPTRPICLLKLQPDLKTKKTAVIKKTNLSKNQIPFRDVALAPSMC